MFLIEIRVSKERICRYETTSKIHLLFGGYIPEENIRDNMGTLYGRGCESVRGSDE